jgi:periplasmic divalent cation tolerance protein
MKLIVSTAPEEEADRIASGLLEAHLVACVNLVRGVRSRYWWKGELEEAGETILLMKTTAGLVEGAIEKLVELHPYDVPEAVVFDAAGGWQPYLDWVEQVTAKT